MSREDFEQLFVDVLNWGRWGKDDQLGTLNLITPARRVAAVGEVREGIAISLSRIVNIAKDPSNLVPLGRELYLKESGEPQIADERIRLRYHGIHHSHVDGLQHIAYKGRLYNGVPFSYMKPDGMEALGVDNMGINGIFGRGVLVDMPRFMGVEHLDPGAVIRLADIRAWEEASGIAVESGDVLLVRTGRWARPDGGVDPDGKTRLAGLHPSVAGWLAKRDVAVIGTDAILDVEPPVGTAGLANLPLHTLVLVAMGMPILDNLDLEALADHCAKTGRSTFLFTGAPLRIRGATGSPMNPLAVF